MKSVFITFIILLLLALLYWLGLFDFFAKKQALAIAFILVGATFLARFKVLGNPFAGFFEDNDDDKS